MGLFDMTCIIIIIVDVLVMVIVIVNINAICKIVSISSFSNGHNYSQYQCNMQDCFYLPCNEASDTSANSSLIYKNSQLYTNSC